MAVSYPGISYLRGYEPKDPLEQFAKGFGFGEGIRNEAGAKDALSQYIDSLTGGQARSAAGSQRNVVDQSIASARAAQPPAELTAALDAKYKPGDAAGRAMQFFMSKGYSQPQAAGIVGNLMQESGLNVGAINPGDGRDGSDSIGIAQWNGPRAQALRAYATQNGLDLNDLDTQFGFIDHELRSTEQGAFNRLMQAQDPIQAAAAFVGYERPQGWTAENPYNSHGWGNRARHAAQLAGGTYDAGAQQGSQSGSTMPRAEILKALVQNPLTREFGLQVATGKVDPAAAQKGVVINGKLVNPLTGQIIGDYSDGADAVKYGLTPIWGQFKDGSFGYGVQGSDGSFKKVDTGDLKPLDPSTLAGEKAAGATSGKQSAEAEFSLPQAALVRDQTVRAIEAVLSETKGMDEQFGNILGFPQQMTPAWPGSEKAKFQVAHERAINRAFLEGRQMLRGGGTITDFESRKAEAAITEAQIAMEKGDKEQYIRSLNTFKEAVRDGYERLQMQANSWGRPTAEPPAGQQTTTGVQWSFEP